MSIPAFLSSATSYFQNISYYLTLKTKIWITLYLGSIPNTGGSRMDEYKTYKNKWQVVTGSI